MTVIFDGWDSAGGRKLLRMLATVVNMKDGVITNDLSSTTDITAVPETAALVRSLLDAEMGAACSASAYDFPRQQEDTPKHASLLVGLVSDSASPNVSAKNDMCAERPTLLGGACFAHQLNLLTGFIITHPSLRSAAARCNKVVTFFTHSTKWKGQLEVCMDAELGKRMGLIKRAETRWFSHHAMAKRLLLKPALQAWSAKFSTDRSLLATATGGDVVDLLRSRRFWDHVGLLVTLLHPIFVEIGIVESRSSNLATVCSTFGRLYAYFLELKRETALRAADGMTVLAPVFAVAKDPTVMALTHQLCGSVLRHLQWRFTHY